MSRNCSRVSKDLKKCLKDQSFSHNCGFQQLNAKKLEQMFKRPKISARTVAFIISRLGMTRIQSQPTVDPTECRNT